MFCVARARDIAWGNLAVEHQSAGAEAVQYLELFISLNLDIDLNVLVTNRKNRKRFLMA